MTALICASALVGAALFACGGTPRATESEYRYAIGEALFPQLAPGVYRIVPTLNLGEIPGLILRGGSVEVR